MFQKCEYCCKSLRRCKRLDFVGRSLHFSCIEKLRKIKWDEDYQQLKDFLISKGVLLIR